MKIHSNKNITKQSGLTISINYINDVKKEEAKNDQNYTKEKSISNDKALKPNKKRVVKISSISSNFSNINFSEPLNLAMNKNDSFIYSIVNEIGKVKN